MLPHLKIFTDMNELLRLDGIDKKLEHFAEIIPLDDELHWKNLPPLPKC